MKINFSTTAHKIVLAVIWACYIMFSVLILYMTYKQQAEAAIIYLWVFFVVIALFLSAFTIYCLGYYRITSRRITKCWLGGLYRKEYYCSDFKYIGRCLREENMLTRFDVKYEGEYFDAYKSDNIFFLFSLYPKGKIPRRRLKNALHMLYSVDLVVSPLLESTAFFTSLFLAYCPKVGDSKVIALPYSKELDKIVKSINNTINAL